MAKINFGGVIEEVITAEEFTMQKAGEVLQKECIAVLDMEFRVLDNLRI